MVDQVRLNDGDMICHLMNVSSWLRDTALFPGLSLPFIQQKMWTPNVFAYSIISFLEIQVHDIYKGKVLVIS